MWSPNRSATGSLRVALLASIGIFSAGRAYVAQPVANVVSESLRYRVGDDDLWAAPKYDDSSWPELASSTSPAATVPEGRLGPVIWFRTAATLSADSEPAGVLISRLAHGSYTVFASGVVVGQYGAPDRLLPRQPSIFPIPRTVVDAEGAVAIAIRFMASPWVGRRGLAGFKSARIEVDEIQRLQDRRELWNSEALMQDLDALVLAIVFGLVAMYHLLVYRWRTELDYVWFSVVAAGFAVNTLSSSVWAYQITANEGVIVRLANFSGHLIAAASIQFLWGLAARPISPLLRVYQLSHLGLGGLVMVSSLSTVFATEDYRWLWLAPLILTMAVLAVQTRRTPELRPVSTGLAIMLVAEVYEMGAHYGGWSTEDPVAAWGFAALLGTMALALAERFGRVYAESSDARAALQREIQDRNAALAESETRYRELFDGAREMIQSVNTDGRFEYVNPFWCDTLGYTHEEARALQFTDIVAPEHVEKCRRLFAALQTGKEFRDVRTVFITKQKRRVYVEGTVSPRSENGRFVATKGFFRDVSERQVVEDALRASEDRYRDLVENVHEWICTHGLDGRILSVNKAAVTGAGFDSSDELVGRNLQELLSPEVRSLFSEYLRRIARDGHARGFLRVSTPSGHKTLEYDNTLRTEGLERPIVRGVARDVTERRRLEQKVKLQKALLECQSEAAADGTLVVSEDREWLLFNQRFVEMWQIPIEVVETGSSVQALAVVSPLAVDPEAFRAHVEALYEDRDRKSTSEVGLKDGRCFELHSAPVIGADGHFYGRLWSYRDITHRKQIESELREHRSDLEKRVKDRTMELTLAYETLRESQESLARAQAIAHVGSWEWNVVSGEVRWSEELHRILGVSASDVAPSYEELLERIHPDDRALTHEVRDGALSGGERYTIDHRIERPNGEVRTLREQAEVSLDEFGQASRMVGTVQDITESTELEQRFRLAQKMEAVGRLAAGIAHDFNNLLMVTQGYSEQLVSEFDAGDPNYVAADEILRASRRAASLTRQLLVFSRRESANPATLRLGEVVTNTERMLARLIGEDITLTTHPDTADDYVYADRGHIEQVIMNLAINARDAMPDGGRLDIRTTIDTEDVGPGHGSEGGWVILEVRDTGSGMDPETLSRAFEPFFTTKDVGKGTGLGLATVYGIVDQCGGNITVESTPTRGTMFKVALPRATPERITRPQLELADRTTVASLPATVLMVEDEEMLRDFMESYLASQGFSVLVARDGLEGLEIGRSHGGPIHLLATDVVMPGVCGPELAAALRDERPELRVLFMSGYAEAAFERFPELKSSDMPLLRKPFSLSKLAETIRVVLTSQMLRDSSERPDTRLGAEPPE